MEFAKLPKVDRLIESPMLAEAKASLGARTITAMAREVIATARDRVREGEPAPEPDAVVREVLAMVVRQKGARATRVVNATGVLLHTNLGRAPLPREAVDRLVELVTGYQNLEFDIELGKRSKRGASLERALAELCGAGDALLTNNNAAGVLLALSHLAAGREVIVSRGELVEIGGGFRVPDVLARSGARLVEVGTTNRTRTEDYARAITKDTACLLRVHPSNFEITGFTERPPLSALADVAHHRGIVLVKDLGGGLLLDAKDLPDSVDLSTEPTVQSCLRAGADLVCFSLDKLFGGPQGGVVAGSPELVRALRKDPLARAVRVDKLTLTALEPVVDAYRRADYDAIPVLAMLRRDSDDARSQVERWRSALGADAAKTRPIAVESAVGGGTLAGRQLDSWGLAIDSKDPDSVARELRRASPPVVARIADDTVILDARTVRAEEDPAVVAALKRALCRAR